MTNSSKYACREGADEYAVCLIGHFDTGEVTKRQRQGELKKNMINCIHGLDPGTGRSGGRGMINCSDVTGN